MPKLAFAAAVVLAMNVPILVFGIAAASALVAPIAGPQEEGWRAETSVGKRLNVQLPAQLGTGFSWSLSRSGEPYLKLMASRITPGQVQAGGVQTQEFEFHADKAGDVTLVFEYRRPWEKDIAPARRYVLTVSIKPV